MERVTLNFTVSSRQAFEPKISPRPDSDSDFFLIVVLTQRQNCLATYNPHFKMRSDYRWMYAIAAKDAASSRWFDEAVKVDMHSGAVAARWSAPSVYLTEFDFAPTSASVASADEDDGLLLTVLYNASADESSFGVFDAKTLTPLSMWPLGAAVPFHAHGIVCSRGAEGGGQRCFSNP